MFESALSGEKKKLNSLLHTEMEMQFESALSVHDPRPMELSTFGNAGPEVNGKLRKSSLESPIMLLTGHQSAVYTIKFNPSGTIIASGSDDKEIVFLWNVHGDRENFAVLKGHKNAVLDVQWTTDGSTIISASPDKTVRAWDVEIVKQIIKMIEHSSFVNSCCPAWRGPPLIVSGSDDGTAKLWDMRQSGAIQTFPDKYQITVVAFSDASDKIYTGGIDNDVKVWDLRRNEVTMTLQGHQDIITGMQLSPDGSYLLTNGMDCTLRLWDMRPYAPQNRCVKLLEGHQHNFEKNLLKCGWSPDGSKVTAGSSDTMVYTWDTTSRRILYKLPGHNGCVNETALHPSGYVPEEIIEDILVKLPVKSIIRFKTVSKSWFNLIKSTNFIYKHSQEDMPCFLHAMCLLVSDRLSRQSSPAVCIYHKETSSSSAAAASHSGIFNTSQNPQASDYKWLTVPELPCPGGSLVLVGSCNGILCFNHGGNIILVNPLLSEVKKLPHRTIIGFDLVGFGFDNTTMDFKVVRIVRKQTHQVVQVCNLRSNAWRELDETGIPLVEFSLDNICSTFLDGKVYWCVFDKCKYQPRILTFNMATELFQLMEFPQDYPYSTRISNQRLIVIDQESLAFVSYPRGSYSMDLDLVHLWTMNNKHNENEQVTTWTKLCSFQPPPHLLAPISFSKKHNKFLYQTTQVLDNRLIIYDLINQSSSSIFQRSEYLRRRNIRNPTWLQVGVLRPSLISLN